MQTSAISETPDSSSYTERLSPTAPRIFEDRDDICHFFDASPLKLADYIETGLHRHVGVLITHLFQLSEKSGMPLMCNGLVHESLPLDYYEPEQFWGIAGMIRKVREKYQ